MMRHDRNEPANERLDRYAEAMTQFYGDGVVASPEEHRRRFARAVMAVADAEQAELRAEAREQMRTVCAHADATRLRAEAAEAEVERLRAEIRDRESERADLRDRVQKAEAQVARVEALADSLDVLGNLPIEERPDGLTATVKACTALAGDLRATLKDQL